MRVAFLTSLICVAYVSIGSGAILGPSNEIQELFAYQEKIYILHEQLAEECPGYAGIKRGIADTARVSFHLGAAIKLYDKLIDTLIKCQGENGDGKIPVTDGKSKRPHTVAKDCQEYYERGHRISGVYGIYIPNSGLQPFNVRCDFQENVGWTVFQKRQDGSVDFYRDWEDYEYGFGNPNGEFWLGNERLHWLTRTNKRLNVFLEAANGTSQGATWQNFTVSDSADKYRLKVSASGYRGGLGQRGMTYQDGMQFSTKDQDNDPSSKRDCAKEQSGGWWYNDCHTSNLNGVYNRNTSSGLSWNEFSFHLVKTVMRLSRG